MEFKPNRSKKNLRILYWICAVFMLLGLLASGGDATSKGAFFGYFAFVILLMGHFLTTAPNTSYTVNETEILLKAWRTQLPISFTEIAFVDELTEVNAEEMMLKLKKAQDLEMQDVAFGQKGSGMGIGEKIKEEFSISKKALAPYKFLSVPIMYKGNNRGRHAETYSVNLPCDCVLIKLKNHAFYLISPLNTAGFVMEVRRHLGKPA